MLDLPLESIHKNAFNAALASHCARDQGKFWEMHQRLFENSRQLEPLSDHAAAIGLDVDAFNQCMTTRKYEAEVRKDMALARKAGATGTPAFIIARTDPDDPTKVTGISFMKGAQPFNAFKQQIDKALASGP